MKIKATKHIALFLCLTMLATLIFSAPISAETGSAIVKILSGTELALGETLKVNAQIPSLTTKAELYLDDALLDEVTEAEDDGKYILSGIVPQTAIGTKTLKLVVDGETAYTDTIEVYKKVINDAAGKWLYDFTDAVENTAEEIAALAAGSTSTKLTDYTRGIGITYNPQKYCKFYVGNLNGNKAMVGHFSSIETSNLPRIFPHTLNKNFYNGIVEFSFDITPKSNIRIHISNFKLSDGETHTLTKDYDIAEQNAGYVNLSSILTAAGDEFKGGGTYNYKFVYDLAEQNYKLYVDNILSQTGSLATKVPGYGLDNFILNMRGMSAPNWDAPDNSVFYIDNFSMVNYAKAYAPKATSLSCDEETLVLSDAIIPVGAETVTAVMDTELTSANAYIEDATGTRVADAAVEGKNVSADISEIKADGQYYLVVETADAKTVIPFKAYYACGDDFMVATSVKLEGNNVVASFDAVNGGAEKDVKFILCTYDDKALLDLKILPLTVTAGNKANETMSLSKSTADSAKVMLWYDSETDITPIIASKDITIGAQQ